MRSQISTVLAGAVGLAAIVAAAPAMSSDTDVCEPVSTVFVTVPQPVTITVHDASTNTVGLSSSAGALPTTTITRYATLHSTLTIPRTNTVHLSHPESSDGIQAAVSSPISYETTVFETAHVTVTVHQPGPSSSSSSVLAFIVENGTTFWLGGQTPVSTKVYVTATSVVTIEPVNTAVGTTHLASTVTLHSTRYTTRSATQTLTRTLSAFNGTTTQTSGAHVASSFGTAPAPVRPSSSWAGWNATSTAGGAVFPGATDPSKISKSAVSFITKETVDIYKTSDFSYTVSTYTAKGGFNVFTTPTTWSADPRSTSMAGGAWTTAVINGQTVSWNAHGVTQTCTESSTRAPYTNTTSTAHRVISAGPSSTSSAQGAWTTAVIDGHTVSWSGNGVTETCTESSTRAPYTNTTSTAHHMSTSMAAGEATSSGDPTSLSSVATASSSSSSKWYIYTPASSVVSGASATGSALGDVTSVSSSSISSSAQPVSVSIATVIPIPAPSATTLSSSQVVDPAPTSESPSQLGSSTVIPSSHLGVFPTSSSSTFLTVSSSSAIEPSASLQTSGTSNTASSTSTALSGASSAPSSCGEVGDFVLNFDDIPPLSISNDSTFGQAQPIFSPYHHFDFSQGFTVGPPPVDPYVPESKPLLVEFTPTANTVEQTRPNADAGTSGYMGNADHGLTTCFSFNFYGASFGCNSIGPDCDFTFTGYRYDTATKSTQPVFTQQRAISACPDLESLECILTPITLNSAFENLDSVRIDLTVQGESKIWWMDDVRLGWFNNTCEKGMCRAKAPVHGFVTPLPVKMI